MYVCVHQRDELFRENAVAFAEIDENSSEPRLCLNSLSFGNILEGTSFSLLALCTLLARLALFRNIEVL